MYIELDMSIQSVGIICMAVMIVAAIMAVAKASNNKKGK